MLAFPRACSNFSVEVKFSLDFKVNFEIIVHLTEENLV